MTAENSAIIMTNERKGHRMEEENVNTFSPKKEAQGRRDGPLYVPLPWTSWRHAEKGRWITI